MPNLLLLCPLLLMPVDQAAQKLASETAWTYQIGRFDSVQDASEQLIRARLHSAPRRAKAILKLSLFRPVSEVELEKNVADEFFAGDLNALEADFQQSLKDAEFLEIAGANDGSLRKSLKKIAQAAQDSWLNGNLIGASTELGGFEAPFYAFFGNRLNVQPEGGAIGSDLNVAEVFAQIHEFEHAFQTHGVSGFGSFARVRVFVQDLIRSWAEKHHGSAVSKILTLMQEAPAVGAQWELAQRVSKPTRDTLISKLQAEILNLKTGNTLYARNRESTEKLLRLRTAQKIREIALESLLFADLSKQEFILRQLQMQGYL